jgi:hypothetical protein
MPVDICIAIHFSDKSDLDHICMASIGPPTFDHFFCPTLRASKYDRPIGIDPNDAAPKVGDVNCRDAECRISAAGGNETVPGAESALGPHLEFFCHSPGTLRVDFLNGTRSEKLSEELSL